jgi:hypothetical protein
MEEEEKWLCSCAARKVAVWDGILSALAGLVGRGGVVELVDAVLERSRGGC